MRDRRPLLGGTDAGNREGTISKFPSKEKRRYLHEEQPEPMTIKKALGCLLFFFVAVGIPLAIIYCFTPFFVVENLGCRLSDKVWGDDTVRMLEEAYHHQKASPPRFPSLEYNKTMMWGTYEPGLLFAMKTRTPKPVYVGIAWYDEAGLRPVRHNMVDILSLNRNWDAEESGAVSDEKSGDIEVSWLLHDGVHYGHLFVQDGPAKINIEFLKSPSGETWHVRVHGQMDGGIPLEFIVYVVNEGGSALEPEPTATGGSGDLQIKSDFEDANGRREAFALLLHDHHSHLFSSSPWNIHGWHSTMDAFFCNINFRKLPWNAYEYTMGSSGIPRSQHPKAKSGTHNVMVFRKKYTSDFRVELSLRPVSHLAAAADGDGHDATVSRPFMTAYESLTTCQLTNAFRLREKDILYQMRRVVAPWTSTLRKTRKLYINRARRLLSGALGAWGFWYGRYLYVDPNLDASWDENGKAVKIRTDEQLREVAFNVSAFAAVASRTENSYGDITLTGYQLLFMLHWNKEWVKEAIASWLVGAQNGNTGFIPHTAIFTAASRVLASPPARYEHLTFAVPPTILLAISQMMNSGHDESSEKEFFEMILLPLRRWRSWFHKTQISGDNIASLEELAAAKPETEGQKIIPPRYRWRSRDDYLIPSSGMPDYPRAVCPGHHKLEAHVDLFSWIALLSSTISDIETYLGLAETVPKRLWSTWLDEVHWDATEQRYADRVGCPGGSFSPYVGYANIYPLLLGIVDDRERAGLVLELAKTDLMTQYGLMSVSYDSVRAVREAGLRHDNRWVGHVWVPANALMLHALRTKYIDLLGAPAREFCKRLRLFVLAAVSGSKVMHEVLNPVTGAGESPISLAGYRALFLTLLENSP